MAICVGLLVSDVLDCVLEPDLFLPDVLDSVLEPDFFFPDAPESILLLFFRLAISSRILTTIDGLDSNFGCLACSAFSFLLKSTAHAPDRDLFLVDVSE